MFSDQEKEFLKKHYPSKGRRYCSEHLNKPYHTIANMAKEMGLKILPGVRSQIVSKTRTRSPIIKPFDEYRVNPQQFISNHTPESAYILGLLWADGFVDSKRPSEIRLKCVNDDIVSVANTFLKTGDWVVKTNITSKGNRKPSGLIRTSNRPLAEFLLSHNYGPHNISSACSIVDALPNNLKRYWFRGIIDGDGCWYVKEDSYVYNFSLCGHYEQDWTYFERLLDHLSIVYKVSRNINSSGHKNSTVRIRNKSGFITLGDYVYLGYENDEIGLARKYEKYTLAKIHKDL